MLMMGYVLLVGQVASMRNARLARLWIYLMRMACAVPVLCGIGIMVDVRIDTKGNNDER
jgi:hypothetical protein